MFNFILKIFVAILGAIIGLEILTRVGVTPNTSIIGIMVVILISFIPLKFFQQYRNPENQVQLQTVISGATFSAANGLLTPVAIIYLMGYHDLVLLALIGAGLAVAVDATILYFSFDSKVYPAKNPWPPGIAVAETIKATQSKPKSAITLILGFLGGITGKSFGIPTDLLGVAWIGNIFALAALAVGFLIRGYAPKIGYDINSIYMPHGIMIGAGFMALIQIFRLIYQNRKEDQGAMFSRSSLQMKKAIGSGFVAYLAITLFLAIALGVYTEMSVPMLILWIVFAAIGALASELIVGIAAMHSGWFPAFATALIFLVLGLIMGFPPKALAVMVGFVASTGPAFADMAYDLKAGWLVRGGDNPDNVQKEAEGRQKQFFGELLSFAVAIVIVGLLYQTYFSQDLIPPQAKTFVATIQAQSDVSIAKYLIIFGVVGAIIQFIGGEQKQIGVLLATGLLINYPIAGFTVLGALLVRVIIQKIYGEKGQHVLYVLGAGFIAGSAIYSFFNSTLKSFGKKG